MSDAPCTAWVTVQQVKELATKITQQSDDMVMARCADVASAWLWRMTGRQFSGLCGPLTVYPTSKFLTGAYSSLSNYDGSMFDSRSGRYGPQAQFGRGELANEVTLGVYPLRTATVTIDGVALDPSHYQIDDRRYLRRLDGQAWPAINDFTKPTGQPGTWSVVITYGEDPPADGKYAALVLARELVQSWYGDTACRLPDGVQNISRQGVNLTVIDPQQFLAEGLFGIREVDYFIHTANPGKLQQRSTMVNIDRSRPVRT